MEEPRTKPRILVQATEKMVKLGHMGGRAGTGHVSCEVVRGEVQETGGGQGREAGNERKEASP